MALICSLSHTHTATTVLTQGAPSYTCPSPIGATVAWLQPNHIVAGIAALETKLGRAAAGPCPGPMGDEAYAAEPVADAVDYGSTTY
ncbi:hypothetical protein PC116_g27686 [Phytophthora cactorum]|nr:hypothetical protein PC116_g27686 [Phytophthora cactorum]